MPKKLHIKKLDVSFPCQPLSTLEPLVWRLCAIKLGDHNVSVKPQVDGEYRHVFSTTSIKDHKRDEYILRVPCSGRWIPVGLDPWLDLWNGPLGPDSTSGVASLELLRTVPKIPSPEVVAFDPTADNPLKWPYMIQKKIVGQPLSELYFNLPHHLKCVVARELGNIVARIHTIRNGWSGRLVLCDERKHVMVKRIDDESQKIPYEILDGKPTKDPESTLERFAAILRNQLRAWRKKPRDPDAESQILDLEDLKKIFEEMIPWGIWDDTDYCLCHFDLCPNHIMVKGLGEPAISGILDWDDAFFTPLWMSCTPPTWLWKGEDAISGGEHSANRLPATPEEEELKQMFDKAAGPVYARFAYRTQYRLARELLRLMINGFHVGEDVRALTLLSMDWAEFNGARMPYVQF